MVIDFADEIYRIKTLEWLGNSNSTHPYSPAEAFARGFPPPPLFPPPPPSYDGDTNAIVREAIFNHMNLKVYC